MRTHACVRTLMAAACAALPACNHARPPDTQSRSVSLSQPSTQPTTTDGQNEYVRLLADAESQIRDAPEKPQPYYRRCQYLMRLKRYDEGYKAAQESMSKYIAAGNDLAWMLIDHIDMDRFRVDVHFNMGPDERNPPAIGIVRPLSFRVWTKATAPSLVDILDFELGYFDGKPNTAAFGKSTGNMHLNYGMARPDMSYLEIREAARNLIMQQSGNTGEPPPR